ncbi:unnamed protein product, partial [Iphiclides podalirius]
MKTFLIVLLAAVAIVNCQGGQPDDNPEKVHVVDYNPIGDQVYNNNPDKFVPDNYFYKPGNSGPADNGTPQNLPYPPKKYDSPYLRGGK